jgi:[ribosomal protein S5]-alanine N-acetyltransferase
VNAGGIKTVKVLETQRLTLRQVLIDDTDFVLELVNEPAYIRNIGDKGVRNIADARKYILNGPIDSYQRFGFGLYVVELKESRLPIGMCGLLKRDSLDDVDIGYAFLERFWSKGYGFESTTAVLDYGRNTVGLNRIVAVISPDNQSSIGLIEKLGFSLEKTVRLPGYDEDSMLFGRDFPMMI